MPEWYIKRISRLSATYYKNTLDEKKYYIELHDETWDNFVLNNKIVRCRVSRLLNSKGETIISIGEVIDFPCRCMEYGYNVDDYNHPAYGIKANAMVFSDEFVKSYGVRDGDYIDLTLLSVVDTNKKSAEEIFPKRRVNGIISIQPSTDREIPSSRNVENLIESSISGEFYGKLIQDINDAYSYELYRPTHVLLRTLFENLIFKLLKKKFPNDKEMYLTKKGYALDFSRLIDNLKEKRHEFVLYAKLFDADFFTFLDEFREKANASTHILEIYLDKDKIDKDKNKMNHYIKMLDSVITEINSNNQSI